MEAAVLDELRASRDAALRHEEVRRIIAARGEVLARYSGKFKPSFMAHISREELYSFLLFKNNRHWNTIHRQAYRYLDNMEGVRRALVALVDETQPLAMRMDGVASIKGMGTATATAILHVAYPRLYGVWNRVSEDCLKERGLMPGRRGGAFFGEMYVAVNRVLKRVAGELEVDLWTLDAIWWYLQRCKGLSDKGVL